jgi:hypothetical protein
MRFRLIDGVAAATAALALGALSVTPTFAQDAPAASVRTEQTEATLAAGTAILAELSSGLDSKKANPGDKVTARTTEPLKSADSRTIIPRGAKLEGHVTMADARSKGSSLSVLGVQFDKAMLKDGTEIALSVVIQAMAPRQSSGPVGDEDSSPSTIGTTQTSPMSGGHTPPPNSPQTAEGGAPGNFPAAAGPRLDERSRGAVGMKGVSLDAQVVSGRGATIVSSNGKSVKLEDGTRLLLVVLEKKDEATTQ